MESNQFPPYMIAMYANCVRIEAELAVRSFMASYQAHERNGHADQIVGLLQDALNHCAAISRYFWPTSKGNFSETRGEALRAHFRIADDSPLHDRDLRNSLEHFDERLDKWVLGNPVGPIIASPIVAKIEITQDGFGHVFKLLDPETDTLVLLGAVHEFGDLSREVSRLAMGNSCPDD
jgi:hypothetical protein